MNIEGKNKPIITWTIVILNIIIYLWDRQGHLYGTRILFTHLGMCPKNVLSIFSGYGKPLAITTLFTTLFLHGNLMHLLMNMIALVTFGTVLELVFGSTLYACTYIIWGFIAGLTHLFLNQESIISLIGASGAISGIMGAYLILFPKSKLTIILPPFLLFPVAVAAWIILLVWFIYQIFIPQQGVANWAHIGGFLSGGITIFILGGWKRFLSKIKNRISFETGEFYED